MASSVGLAIQRQLRGVKGLRGGQEETEVKIVVACILCFGVLSACSFLWAKGICSLWRRYLCEAATDLKYMVIASCKSVEPQRSCMPPSKPVIQPPPLQFSFRQSSIVSRSHHSVSQQACNVHVPQTLAQSGCSQQEQPPSQPKVIDLPTRHVGISKVPRGNSASSMQDVPRLPRRKRSLAIPWFVLEGSEKYKRSKRDYCSRSSCCPSSNGTITVAGQLLSNNEPTKNAPAVTNEDLPRLLGRPCSLTKEIPKYSRKIHGEGIRSPADSAIGSVVAPQPSPPPSAIVPKSGSNKNGQRFRKKPCYRSSSCPDNITSTTLTSGNELFKGSKST